MYGKSIGTEPGARQWLFFDLRNITGTWVSREGAPTVRIFRNRKCKNGCIHLELTYKNPQAGFRCPIRQVFGIRYFDLFGRVGLAYDAEHDVLHLSAYGEYFRVED